MIILCDKTRHAIGQPFTPSIQVIARAMSNINRFTGHAGQYSVAQHCVLASRQADRAFALDVLLHDAPEAYIGDVSSPLKRHLPNYQSLELFYHRTIDRFFAVTTMHPHVREVDLRMLVTEAYQLGVWIDPEDYPLLPPYSIQIEPWEPKRAEAEFLERFLKLRGEA